MSKGLGKKEFDKNDPQTLGEFKRVISEYFPMLSQQEIVSETGGETGFAEYTVGMTDGNSVAYFQYLDALTGCTMRYFPAFKSWTMDLDEQKGLEGYYGVCSMATEYEDARVDVRGKHNLLVRDVMNYADSFLDKLPIYVSSNEWRFEEPTETVLVHNTLGIKLVEIRNQKNCEADRHWVIRDKQDKVLCEGLSANEVWQKFLNLDRPVKHEWVIPFNYPVAEEG